MGHRASTRRGGPAARGYTPADSGLPWVWGGFRPVVDGGRRRMYNTGRSRSIPWVGPCNDRPRDDRREGWTRL